MTSISGNDHTNRSTASSTARAWCSLDATVASLRDQSGRLQGAEQERALVELRAAERRLSVAAAKLAALEVAQH